MPSDRLAPSPNRSALGNFLLHTRRGQLLLVLCGVRFLGALELIPAALTSLATVGLWAYAIVVILWGVLGLRTKLLWRIRRKLVISYLLIGLVPTVLILSFFAVMGYFTLGQMSSYMLNATVRTAETRAARVADRIASDLAASRRGRSRARDAAIRDAMKKGLATLAVVSTEGEADPKPPDGKVDPVPAGSGAIYLEHRRGRIQRVVVSKGVDRAPSVGKSLPDWLDDAYQGSIVLGERVYSAGASTPGLSDGATVIVLSPLSGVLADAAVDLGFHIDQVLASSPGESSGESLFLPVGEQVGSASESPSWTIPWWALFATESFERASDERRQLVFVQFGFPLFNFYQSIASGALPLGPSRPDVSRLLLTGMMLLATLFLVIQVFAIFVGFVLARSITGSVHALSQGTEHVRQGDFGYKVQIRSRDQLGELAESFNLMTTSIEDLLRQSTEKERLEEELRIARSIQMSLLPKDRVHIPGLSISALCLPATEVGGDYYDFISLDDDRHALLIADVSGKGTSAALYMAELKGLVLSLSRIYDSPRKLLIEANKILAANLDSRSFITMAYAVIDMKARRMTYARAGHNPIFHLSGATNPPNTRVLAPDGLGLALDRGTQFERILREDSVALETDDLFLFFTDGVSESMNAQAELFGEERIREILEDHRDLEMEELREKMIDEVFDFAGGAVQHDDMTMVLVKVL